LRWQSWKIAAGILPRTKRWDAVKWGVSVNLALAAAAAIPALAEIQIYLLVLSRGVAAASWLLVLHYNRRVAGIRKQVVIIIAWMKERGVDYDSIEAPALLVHGATRPTIIQHRECRKALKLNSTRRVGVISKRGWKRKFEDPIPLPRGRQLVTLEDAARYIQKLPKAEQQIEEWRTAVEVLILVEWIAQRGVLS
jgi:hypothetical protein